MFPSIPEKQTMQYNIKTSQYRPNNSRTMDMSDLLGHNHPLKGQVNPRQCNTKTTQYRSYDKTDVLVCFSTNDDQIYYIIMWRLIPHQRSVQNSH